jgi:hypothetical protein
VQFDAPSPDLRSDISLQPKFLELTADDGVTQKVVVWRNLIITTKSILAREAKAMCDLRYSSDRIALIFFSAAIVMILSCVCPAFGFSGVARNNSTLLAGEGSTGVPSGAPVWAVQIDFTKPNSVPWDASDFAAIAHSGINWVEINLDWGDIEPRQGQYDFKLLDSYLAGTAKAHIRPRIIKGT